MIKMRKKLLGGLHAAMRLPMAGIMQSAKKNTRKSFFMRKRHPLIIIGKYLLNIMHCLFSYHVRQSHVRVSVASMRNFPKQENYMQMERKLSRAFNPPLTAFEMFSE